MVMTPRTFTVIVVDDNVPMPIKHLMHKRLPSEFLTMQFFSNAFPLFVQLGKVRRVNDADGQLPFAPKHAAYTQAMEGSRRNGILSSNAAQWSFIVSSFFHICIYSSASRYVKIPKFLINWGREATRRRGTRTINSHAKNNSDTLSDEILVSNKANHASWPAAVERWYNDHY